MTARDLVVRLVRRLDGLRPPRRHQLRLGLGAAATTAAVDAFPRDSIAAVVRDRWVRQAEYVVEGAAAEKVQVAARRERRRGPCGR